MPLEQHPTDPDKLRYVPAEYNLPKPWVDLTEEEFDELEYRFARYELCRAIGAALRSKNT